MRARDLLACSLVATVVLSAFAHETWMMPSKFSAKVGEDIRLDVSSGMAFPRLESAIRVDRVAKAAFRLGNAEARVTLLKMLESSLELRQSFPKAGLATIWLDLKPKEIELSDDEVAEYLDEIGATEDLRSRWAGQKGRIAWKETYTKHAKTFMAVGDARADGSWADTVDQALEIVPTTSPLTVEVGGAVTVELQASSKPLPNHPVGLLVDGATQRVFRTTDAAGRATFPISNEGRAMLFAVRLLPAKDGRSWNSDFCTMTFEIRRRPSGSERKSSEAKQGAARAMVPFFKGDSMAKTTTKTPARTPSAAFMKPMTPSTALAAVIGSKPVPRTEVTKQLWIYIKKNGLQDAKDKRTINADAALKAVFGGKSSVSMFEMTKLVGKHLT